MARKSKPTPPKSVVALDCREATMDVYRVTGVNHLGSFGRWAFAEFRDVGEIESDFAANVEAAFDGMMDAAMQSPGLNLSA